MTYSKPERSDYKHFGISSRSWGPEHDLEMQSSIRLALRVTQKY
jgi:hypothetical protein